MHARTLLPACGKKTGARVGSCVTALPWVPIGSRMGGGWENVANWAIWACAADARGRSRIVDAALPSGCEMEMETETSLTAAGALALALALPNAHDASACCKKSRPAPAVQMIAHEAVE